jgi:predicted alpha/beta hydrolase family esterase
MSKIITFDQSASDLPGVMGITHERAQQFDDAIKVLLQSGKNESIGQDFEDLFAELNATPNEAVFLAYGYGCIMASARMQQMQAAQQQQAMFAQLMSSLMSAEPEEDKPNPAA